MARWITLSEAARQLGVRAQTVYAYASRGRITVMPDPRDPRKSLYRAEDVSGLSRSKQVGRKRETLAAGTIFGAEPCIYTAITAISKGRLYYRGQDTIRLSESARLEDVARILWGAEADISFDTADMPFEGLPSGRSRAFVSLSDLAVRGNSTLGRIDRALHAEAGGLVGLVAKAFGAVATPPGEAIHLQLARGWGQSAEVAERLRQAMVLLADHELTSSAFSTRITASTGASLAACLLTGLTTFSGPLHGDASGRVRALLDDVQQRGAEKVAAHHLRSAIAIPGFGHHLYPDGDPRAQALMANVSPPAEIATFVERVVALTGLQPNVDFALATMATRFDLPPDAAFALFAVARCTGLLAHGMEQLRVGMVIRPRARYVGPTLEDRKDASIPGESDDLGRPSPDTLAKNQIFRRRDVDPAA